MIKVIKLHNWLNWGDLIQTHVAGKLRLVAEHYVTKARDQAAATGIPRFPPKRYGWRV